MVYGGLCTRIIQKRGVPMRINVQYIWLLLVGKSLLSTITRGEKFEPMLSQDVQRMIGVCPISSRRMFRTSLWPCLFIPRCHHPWVNLK